MASASADALYNRAIALPRHHGERADLLQRALRIDPRHARSYLSLGADERRAGHLKASIALLEVAASLMPGNAAARHHFGESLLAARQPHDAVPHLEAAVAIMPEHAPFEYFRGSALLAAYRLEEASASLSRAAELDPSNAVRTARNDVQLSPNELDEVAASSARKWARLAQSVADPVSPPSHATTATTANTSSSGRRDAARAHAMEWKDGSEPPLRQAPLCTVAEVSTVSGLEAALADASSRSLPMLIRNATAMWPLPSRTAELASIFAADSAVGACTADEGALALAASPADVLLPVSILHANGSTNRIRALASEEGQLTAEVLAHLRARRVAGGLQRPLTQHMRASTLLALLRSGTCASRCYAKQVPLDLYAPRMLRHLIIPRLRLVDGAVELPLGEVNLWLGKARRGAPIRTDLHTDARPNLIALLHGRKRALLLPPGAASRMEPVPLLDVTSAAADSASADSTGADSSSAQTAFTAVPLPGAPRWPRTADQVLLDSRHYLKSLDDARAMLRPAQLGTSTQAPRGDANVDAPPRASACEFEVSAPDALFIPPGWLHAVETLADESTDPPREVHHDGICVAVNAFYNVPN